MKRKFAAGEVIWAVCSDRNRNNPKLRPLLILDAQAPRMRCLCISTDPKQDPGDPAIDMPFDPEGMSETGLLEWCRVVLLWQEWIEAVQIEKAQGRVTKDFLRKVIEQREIALTFRPAK